MSWYELIQPHLILNILPQLKEIQYNKRSNQQIGPTFTSWAGLDDCTCKSKSGLGWWRNVEGSMSVGTAATLPSNGTTQVGTRSHSGRINISISIILCKTVTGYFHYIKVQEIWTPLIYICMYGKQHIRRWSTYLLRLAYMCISLSNACISCLIKILV